MGNNFSSKYELFRNVKADDKKGLNKNYGIFLVLRRKTGRARRRRDCGSTCRGTHRNGLKISKSQVTVHHES